jgi:hypothetical protein
VAEYCSLADLYDFGVPRGAVPNPGRLVESMLANTDEITLDVHGFDLDAALWLRAEAHGSLPPEVTEGATYYAIPRTEFAFAIATSPGGAAINFSANGSRVLVIAPLPELAARKFASRVIDEALPAHLVPLSLPVPEIVRMTAAELAAFKLVGRAGAASKSLADMVAEAQKRMTAWAAGKPIRDANVTAPANLATSAALPRSDPRGWSRFGGL